VGNAPSAPLEEVGDKEEAVGVGVSMGSAGPFHSEGTPEVEPGSPVGVPESNAGVL
jgi:hypothetical protein